MPLTGDQIVAIVADSVAREAMIIEQKRRADWRRRLVSAGRLVTVQS